MAGPEEMSDVQPTGVKRPSIDIDTLQRKKFKIDELPLSAAQHSALDDLLHSFKKKGGFDSVRKKIWAEFDEGVCLIPPFLSTTIYSLRSISTGAKGRVYKAIGRTSRVGNRSRT